MKLSLGNDEDSNGSSSKGEEDRFTSLPDVLLVEILSHLPIDSAVTTSALSRRWRHLWTHVTCIRILRHENSVIWERFFRPDKLHNFCTILHHIFGQLTSPKILTFSLILVIRFTLEADQLKGFDSSLKSWIRHVCARNVEEFELNVHAYGHYNKKSIPLPTCVFETQSLVELDLWGQFNYKLPLNGFISLPNLKKLTMKLGDRNRDLMRILFKSCPLLEDLYLCLDWKQNGHFVDISAQNLKELTIEGRGSFAGCQFRIDAPVLEGFDISSTSLSSHCFVRDLEGLLEASIDVEREAGDDIHYLDKISKLFHGISYVRSLRLTSFVVDSFNNLHDGTLPIFHNLTHLTMVVVHPHGWNGLLRFLQCSPNLEVLVVYHEFEGEFNTGSMDWTTPNFVPVCLLNKLRRMEVEALKGCQKDLNFLGYILSNATILERLLLHNFNYRGASELCKELKFCENLFRCPRSSLACEIEVCGKYFSASSKGFNDDTPDCRIQ